MPNKKPRIAASSYLNAAPLCYSFVYGQQRDNCEFLSDAAPARCAEMLADGGVNAALIPAIEYQRIPNLKAASGACVASRYEVRSVLLASRVPLERVRTVALDISSRTSAALIQIILGRFCGVEAQYRQSPPSLTDMLETSDAALIIGDPAMLIDRSTLHVYDLAEEWRKHTGLPFVFAFWAIRDDSIAWFNKSAESQIDFQKAKVEGLAHLEELASIYAERLGLATSDLLSYLTVNISYDIDDECLRGLRLFYELAGECDLIATPREIVFAS
jgi:chorismate dehydratase